MSGDSFFGKILVKTGYLHLYYGTVYETEFNLFLQQQVLYFGQMWRKLVFSGLLMVVLYL